MMYETEMAAIFIATLGPVAKTVAIFLSPSSSIPHLE